MLNYQMVYIVMYTEYDKDTCVQYIYSIYIYIYIYNHSSLGLVLRTMLDHFGMLKPFLGGLSVMFRA